MFDVVLPAGGTLPSEFAAQVGTQNKALIQIGGRTILDRVFDAIEESGLARRTV
jgi:GTP:adenosylcobinamide-phosphate guanylyltransferase